MVPVSGYHAAMLRSITNRFYRRKDPTRDWVAVPAATDVDLRRCTIGGAAMGGAFAALRGLGPSEDARHAARGYPRWYSKGIFAVIENDRLTDLMLVFTGGEFVPFAGRFFLEGTPVKVSSDSTPESIVGLLGEPFGQSVKEEGCVILFYEYEEGEVQFAFDTQRQVLESIDFQYDPELSDRGACEYYGIEKTFPDNLRRSITD